MDGYFSVKPTANCIKPWLEYFIKVENINDSVCIKDLYRKRRGICILIPGLRIGAGMTGLRMSQGINPYLPKKSPDEKFSASGYQPVV